MALSCRQAAAAVTEPVRIGTNTVPHYRIEWLDPRAGVVACVDMDISADAKQLARLRMFNKNLERPPPEIAVNPQRAPLFPKPNPEYAHKLFPIVFQAIDEYGKKLSLPVPRALETNRVARFFLEDNGGWPHCEVELTNGWRFIYRNSMVNGHYAPDNFFTSDDRPILIREFAGQPVITEQQAVELVRKAISEFNHPTNLVHTELEPKFLRPALPGIPRLFVFWHTESENDLQSKVEAEVDLATGQLKSLYYDDKAYWNHPPPIDVPISLSRTNTPERIRFAKPQTPPRQPPPHFKLPGEK